MINLESEIVTGSSPFEHHVYFRAGVGALILNQEGLVLVAERSDVTGAWQAPQGGLLPGEDPLDAMRREVVEETGIQPPDLTVLVEYESWLGYELPSADRSEKTGRGQVHKWFLLRYIGDKGTIDLPRGKSAEFIRWRWVPIGRLVEKAWSVRQPVYARLADEWREYFR